MKFFIIALLLAVSLARNYPLYKQCDSKWGSQHLGTSSRTICQAGCLMSSAAMALSGLGHSHNPGTLNTWLKSNGGYVSGDQYVWTAINKLGVSFRGRVSNTEIKHNLDAGNVVIVNVHNGAHWVLAHGYSGDNILVNDPGFSTTSYSLSQIVNGNTGVYSVSKMPLFWNNFLITIQETVQGLLGYQQQVVSQKIADHDDQLQTIQII